MLEREQCREGCDAQLGEVVKVHLSVAEDAKSFAHWPSPSSESGPVLQLRGDGQVSTEYGLLRYRLHFTISQGH